MWFDVVDPIFMRVVFFVGFVVLDVKGLLLLKQRKVSAPYKMSELLCMHQANKPLCDLKVRWLLPPFIGINAWVVKYGAPHPHIFSGETKHLCLFLLWFFAHLLFYHVVFGTFPNLHCWNLPVSGTWTVNSSRGKYIQMVASVLPSRCLSKISYLVDQQFWNAADSSFQ